MYLALPIITEIDIPLDPRHVLAADSCRDPNVLQVHGG